VVANAVRQCRSRLDIHGNRRTVQMKLYSHRR
jgi:hypothetical protein